MLLAPLTFTLEAHYNQQEEASHWVLLTLISPLPEHSLRRVNSLLVDLHSGYIGRVTA
jgi:hypothetical protein